LSSKTDHWRGIARIGFITLPADRRAGEVQRGQFHHGTMRREQAMKGGKGGQGRKRSTTKAAHPKEAPVVRGGVKKGSAKRDWGAIPNDAEVPSPPVTPTRAGRIAPPRS
jgi:hypothetical protein